MINVKYFSTLLFLVFLGCTSDKVEIKESSLGRILGETLSLTNEEENYLIKQKITDLKIYSIDSVRNKHYWKENIDYLVEDNKIRRTKKSSIPNFRDHKVILNNDNRFSFNSSPRNPSLTIPFHVYADYNFNDLESIKGQLDNNFLSSAFKAKLKKRENLKIGAIGTSITAGAHTLENFYFGLDKQTYPHLLAKAINRVYGKDVLVNNYSKGGSSIGYLETVFDIVLQDNIDLVLIEFGMNDHIYSWWESGLPSFETRIIDAIKKFHLHNIDVVLVGFFQQNPAWDLEFANSTAVYNQSLKNIAKDNNCYFADINEEFSKYNQKKINEDLCGDFMHHPTSFGHLLYYKTIMPLFLETEVNDGFVYDLVNTKV